MDQQVHLPDGRQELVPQAFALGGAFDQAGHVHELDGGRGELLGFEELAQARQARVRHRHHPGVGGDGAEGVAGHLGVPGGQGIEDGGLAGVRQADDAAGPGHGQ